MKSIERWDKSLDQWDIIYIYMWVNLITTEAPSPVFRKSSPVMAQQFRFGLVKYY